ncbi:unnamed protein product [Brassicogethes aeneus]|uniref:UNC93-like protein MFSD11 n=1 Tax=Brassicogethes aeneus TaxID=1431903 RepID=A0A9P0ATT3_BRAAE|nr:unnamed protein product [Brassicogethes aeneus]
MTYLIANSNKNTIARNAGIYWTFYQLSVLIGNSVVYLVFKGYSIITFKERVKVLCFLAGISATGVCSTFILKKSVKPPLEKDEENDEAPVEPDVGPMEEFLQTLKLIFTRNMLLLSALFFYTGFEMRFWGGVLGPTLGFAKLFKNRKELVGLTGIAVGTGNCFG